MFINEYVIKIIINITILNKKYLLNKVFVVLFVDVALLVKNMNFELKKMLWQKYIVR